MMIAELARRAANDNRRPSQRTRADEQFTMIGIALGASVLFVAVMWVLA
jgi:hypothetical protein